MLTPSNQEIPQQKQSQGISRRQVVGLLGVSVVGGILAEELLPRSYASSGVNPFRESNLKLPILRMEQIMETLERADHSLEAYLETFAWKVAESCSRTTYCDCLSSTSSPQKLDDALRNEFGPSHPDHQFVGAYDASWMPRVWCNNYVHSYLRRHSHLERTTFRFLERYMSQGLRDRLGANPCGYSLVRSPEDYDVVMYGSLVKEGGELQFQARHVAMWYRGMVISKNAGDNVYRQSVDVAAGGAEYALFFRELGMPNPTGRETYSYYGFNDWVERDGAIVRSSADLPIIRKFIARWDDKYE